MEFDADTRHFTSFDALSSLSRRRRERIVCVCVCVFTCVICNIEYVVYTCIKTFSTFGHLFQPSLPCSENPNLRLRSR